MKKISIGIFTLIVILGATAIGIHKFGILPSVRDAIHEQMIGEDKESMNDMNYEKMMGMMKKHKNHENEKKSEMCSADKKGERGVDV